ncbi:winged helix-turn-helix domain-containing protein [Streptomyces sp. CMB-StM0423]|uniref:winged helix-turn-helix domain-containing protein n=1 Tax=Streptomyces sp. CMB-StM0423 TaxID=2059884 RepID=UPI000C7110DE|nr:winged helix-turn-helix domain-containing protein [Streptomyces sp. CMB-StM0423]AUH39891.1 transcriptional regulator [Streptomyces sp. CMB-StM0423]
MAGKLHVHFNDRDFRHVQLARTADPIWEAILGLHVAYTPAPRLPARLRPWHRRARHRLQQHDLRRTCRFVNGIAPADARYFPDFLTPAESEDGITAALRTLRATPATRLAREIRLAARHRPLPSWTRRLAAGDRTVLADLADALHHLHHHLVAPDWSEIEATVAADRARQLEALETGLPAVLATLEPFTWTDPVLTAPYPVDSTLHLHGRGLRLIPSYFCHTTPVALADPGLPPVVVHPVRRHPAPPATTGPTPRRHTALAALLGTSRARILAALTPTPAPATTGGIAARLGMPASSVSGHLTVLRRAGLAESERAGPHVVHRLTARGRHLLDG